MANIQRLYFLWKLITLKFYHECRKLFESLWDRKSFEYNFDLREASQAIKTFKHSKPSFRSFTKQILDLLQSFSTTPFTKSSRFRSTLYYYHSHQQVSNMYINWQYHFKQGAVRSDSKKIVISTLPSPYSACARRISWIKELVDVKSLSFESRVKK